MSIAQDIRRAAIAWPQYLSEVETAIILIAVPAAFERRSIIAAMYADDATTIRTFLLFVAEALDGGTAGKG